MRFEDASGLAVWKRAQATYTLASIPERRQWSPRFTTFAPRQVGDPGFYPYLIGINSHLFYTTVLHWRYSISEYRPLFPATASVRQGARRQRRQPATQSDGCRRRRMTQERCAQPAVSRPLCDWRESSSPSTSKARDGDFAPSTGRQHGRQCRGPSGQQLQRLCKFRNAINGAIGRLC